MNSQSAIEMKNNIISFYATRYSSVIFVDETKAIYWEIRL